ncbi:MAG: hypothetical protein L0Y54_06615, partial [Sporichthyaceae bacterium]|nr:hypothetical protein [Sporichthyaceae bacterium]
QGYDSDIRLLDNAGCSLRSSRMGSFTPTDWVAFDNNAGRLPPGPYIGEVIGHPGNTSPIRYMVQFVQGQRTLSTSTPYTDQPIGASYSAWMVDIRDVYLSVGTTYTFTVTGGLSAVYVLGSATGDPTSWAQTPATAGASLLLPGTNLDIPQTGSLSMHPPNAGWYAALFVRNGWWGAPVTVRVSTSS